MLTKSAMLAAALLIFGGTVFVTAGHDFDYDERVLLNDKCKCIKVTSRFVPSKDNPSEKILERNIEIRIPLKARMNISDPTSPLRTHFVYNLSKLCQKCNPVEIEIGGEPVTASQGNCHSNPDINPGDTCYTYDRKKCYTWEVPFKSEGRTIMKTVALNPDSCYE
ncbi:immunoglobulin J chain [Pelodytes ibericus]